MQLAKDITEEVKMALFAAMRSKDAAKRESVVFFNCKRNWVYWWALTVTSVGCEDWIISISNDDEMCFRKNVSDYCCGRCHYRPIGATPTRVFFPGKELGFCCNKTRFDSQLTPTRHGFSDRSSAPNTSEHFDRIFYSNIFIDHWFPSRILASRDVEAFQLLHNACYSDWVDRSNLESYWIEEERHFYVTHNPHLIGFCFNHLLLRRMFGFGNPDSVKQKSNREKLNHIRSRSIKIKPMEIMAASSRITTLCK